LKAILPNPIPQPVDCLPVKNSWIRAAFSWLPLRSKKYFTAAGVWLVVLLLAACSGMPLSSAPTALPTEFLPTVIALTLEASRPTRQVQASQTASEMEPPTAAVETATPTLTAIPATSTLPPTATQSPSDQPEIPNAQIQMRMPGQLSKVTSPITIHAYLKPGNDGVVQVELLGEDRRVLTRQIVTLPWVDRYGRSTLYIKLEYEIPAAAEAGRLVISTTDEFGRLNAVNSTSLILMSLGEADLVPPPDLLTQIFIQLPSPRTLIQGKNLLVHGFARPVSDDYLLLQLVGEDGNILGKRVTNLETPGDNGYGSFTAEVSYQVSEATPALLVVWMGEGSLSNIVHLSSVEVLLGP